MTCVALAMFLAALGPTIVATTLPGIVADLGGFDRCVWVATAYMVAATVAAPIAGGLSDLYGRKPFFILGLVVFTAASALLGVSHSMNAVIQALITTLLTTVGMVLISTMNETTGVGLILTWLAVTGIGIGGTLTVLSVVVQNSVPFSLVGAGTSASQFWRIVGGMMGLAAMGAVMVQSFRSAVEAAVPDSVRVALPEGLLDSVKEDPQVLLDPATAGALKGILAEAGNGDIPVADSLLASLNAALAGALSDVFTVLAVAAALSFAMALFLRVRTGAETQAIGTEA